VTRSNLSRDEHLAAWSDQMALAEQESSGETIEVTLEPSDVSADPREQSGDPNDPRPMLPIPALTKKARDRILAERGLPIVPDSPIVENVEKLHEVVRQLDALEDDGSMSPAEGCVRAFGDAIDRANHDKSGKLPRERVNRYGAVLAPLCRRFDEAQVGRWIDETRASNAPKRERESGATQPSPPAATTPPVVTPPSDLTAQELEQVDCVLVEILNTWKTTPNRPRLTMASLHIALAAEPRAPWCSDWKFGTFEAAFIGRKWESAGQKKSAPPRFPRAHERWLELRQSL
jgi:hypothetical protein